MISIIDIQSADYSAASPQPVRAALIGDTVADLPAPNGITGYTLIQGSTCIVIADSALYRMQSGGTWVQQLQDITADTYTRGQIDTLLAGKQSVLTFDSAPTDGSSNPVTSAGIFTAFQTFELPKTLAITGSIHQASPGWWSRVSNLALVTDTPSDYSGGFQVHVLDTGIGNPHRKKIFFYPLSAGYEGTFYIQTELAPVQGIPVWSAWYKFVGSQVT